jgi:hypothetical protein
MILGCRICRSQNVRSDCDDETVECNKLSAVQILGEGKCR